ncbi:MAG: DNA translocase FtsK [Caldilinea sp.]|nr:DNA translocase FtsK [Caldilineaceae bacterium]MCB9123350.1 DNA translocase FtsK [Caldilineaceae bacterium]MCO5208345.1 DNA translocase FtsK [Caldilinea sp.]MCW5839889.1 DNA translocase FtsK [Caldilinea sp.]
MTKQSPLTYATNGLAALRDNLRGEFVGALLVILGGFLLWRVAAYVPGDGSPPLLTTLTGWTAPLFAASLVIIGLVLIFRRRAGYWSAEALIGVELLLLGLMGATFVRSEGIANWNTQFDGTAGGVIGWALGNLALNLLGASLALLLFVILAIAGLVLLVRYTPLIYAAAAVGRMLPVIPAVASRVAGLMPGRRHDDDDLTMLPRTPNFVPAAPAPEETVDYVPATPPSAPGKKTRAANVAATNPAPPPSKSAAGAKAPTPKPLRTASALPPRDLLAGDSGAYGNSDVHLLQQLIVSTLEDFNVPVRVVHVETGPTVTQFGVEPLYVESAGQKRKVRVSRIVNLADDLALALAAPAVRIEAPVPGRPYVGIEVPNPDKSLVSLRGIVESQELRKAAPLALPLGRNTAGAPVVMDLTKAPHMLIAGATGSGKSVCINAIVTGLLMQHGPESLRFIMVDPKMVELPGYNGIPHLYGKVITDVEQVMGALTWLLLQMDDRYQLFRDLGVRNIDAYNTIMRKQKGGQPLPYIVLVIDELADLMMTAAEDIERQICRLAQMARATGIHLVLATQRPSTDVITGLIKANFPSRIAFAVTSQIDSRVILDTPGAERLLGRGDMLLMRPDLGKLQRVQGCFVSDDEIGAVVNFWKAESAGEPRPLVVPWKGILDQLDDEDEMIQDAIDVVRGMKTCSTSMLQRKLNIGYPKAARLMEDLEKRGVVGPDLGAGRGREVLAKRKEEDGDESDDYDE